MTGPLTMVGISGGVDSAVAALLLRDAGETVAGAFMQNWEEDDPASDCHADDDRREAVATCAELGIPLSAWNFAAEYRRDVFARFLSEYRVGRTPNPDVMCNRHIKFRAFLDRARSEGASHVATGHYARVAVDGGRRKLLRGADRAKDQSYFLHTLDQEQLAAARFPVGALTKPQVRELARRRGLANHARRDSTGICFIGERDFRGFLAHYLPANPGEMRTPDDVPVGEHQGVHFYTLGQRDGLGIGGRREFSGTPWYVVGKDFRRNIIYVAQRDDHRWIESRRLACDAVHWIAGAAPGDTFRCTAKVRYRQDDQPCTVTVAGEGCEVAFDAPQRAVTAGQSVVFYQEEECLGGGVIERCDAPFGEWNRDHA
ncbi:MAG: tRNA 2-thiouridine(34) synthase MnmA [Lysobacterales bacterium]